MQSLALLAKTFRPITATPFKKTADYAEHAPCQALRPYVRCFWGTAAGGSFCSQTLVIPDVCCDVIFCADYEKNIFSAKFCGVNERAFFSNPACKKNFTFAVRFYAWAAAFFSDENFLGTKNSFLNSKIHFKKLTSEILLLLSEKKFADEKILIPHAERILLSTFCEKRVEKKALDAAAKIIFENGNLSVQSLASDACLCARQFEWIFQNAIGVSAKSFSSMVRHQALWQEVLRKKIDTKDAVLKYGYFDEAHLFHDFKKFHTMNIKDAKIFAQKNVANLQDKIFLPK